MYKNDLSARRYSDAFKLKILDEFSKGKYSKRDLSRLYGIRSSTINDWIKKFDRKDLMNTRIIVDNADEISKLNLLQKEIEQLKKANIKEIQLGTINLKTKTGNQYQKYQKEYHVKPRHRMKFVFLHIVFGFANYT
jgi:transposase-like protein